MTNIILTHSDDSKNIIPPAKKGDACYDLVAKSVKMVGDSMGFGGRTAWKRLDYIEYDTGVRLAPHDEMIFSITASRSSVSKYNLVLANGIGTIDNGYRGSLIFRFKYVWQPEDFIVDASARDGMCGYLLGIINEDKIYKIGDRIGQIRFEKNIPVLLMPTESLPESDRKDGGFGSTGI